MQARFLSGSVLLLGGLVTVGLLFCFPGSLAAQVIVLGDGMGGKVLLHQTDMAIFAAGEERRDLPCTVSPNRPILGFDLRFHASYEVAIPLRELGGGGEDLLSILFRVDLPTEPKEPIYFTQRIRVPSLEEGVKGDAYLHGTFDVGEGDYKVAWLMRDRAGRVCSSFWDVEARLSGNDRDIGLNIRPSEVRQTELEQFKEEPPVIRSRGDRMLRVKVLVNFAPQNPHAATLQPTDTSALVAILRAISREPRIGKFSVVAFNLHEQRVIHRQDDADRIDFPALGESLDTLELGTIDLARLSDKHGETRFLTELMQQELGGQPPDALIFAGPKAMLSRRVAEEELRSLGELRYPVFYMNYNLYPQQIPWRDTIGEAVRSLDGLEYTISRPRDLWYAISEMVSQIAKKKESRPATTASSE